MHSSEYGDKVRDAIRKKGFTMQKAADKLGMSRRNLYYYLGQKEPDDSFVQSVQSKLHIVVQMGNEVPRISKVPIIFDTSEGGQPELFLLRQRVILLESQVHEKENQLKEKERIIQAHEQTIRILTREKVGGKNGQ